MTKRILFIAIPLSLLLFFFAPSCKTIQLIPDPPTISEGQYPQFPALDQLSTVQVPIAIPVESIRKEINARHKLAKIAGTIYLKGFPYLDIENQTVQIRDINYDLKTKNFLANTTDWLLHEKFIQQIEEKAIFDIKPHTEKTKATANQQLANLAVNDNLKIKGSLDILTLKNLILSQKALIIAVQVKGKPEVEVLNIQ